VAVLALLEQPTIKAAARQVGISERALRCWLRLPQFRERLAEARRQAFDVAMSRLQSVSGEAVAVIARVLRKKKADDGLKLKAALGLLGHGLKVAELTDLADRLAAIEVELAKPARNGTTHPNGRVNGRAKT
jgi:hypothetical protein